MDAKDKREQLEDKPIKEYMEAIKKNPLIQYSTTQLKRELRRRKGKRF